MEHEFFLVGVHQSPSAFPLHRLLVLLKVPTLRLIEGHEKQCELPRVYQLLSQGALSTHQQRPYQAGVDILFLRDSIVIFK